MSKIFINAKRDGYGTDQVGQTMNVRELIAFLEQFDDETPVYLRHDGGYTYGSITEYNFEENDDDQEEE